MEMFLAALGISLGVVVLVLILVAAWEIRHPAKKPRNIVGGPDAPLWGPPPVSTKSQDLTFEIVAAPEVIVGPGWDIPEWDPETVQKVIDRKSPTRGGK